MNKIKFKLNSKIKYENDLSEIKKAGNGYVSKDDSKINLIIDNKDFTILIDNKSVLIKKQDEFLIDLKEKEITEAFFFLESFKTSVKVYTNDIIKKENYLYLNYDLLSDGETVQNFIIEIKYETP